MGVGSFSILLCDGWGFLFLFLVLDFIGVDLGIGLYYYGIMGYIHREIWRWVFIRMFGAREIAEVTNVNRKLRDRTSPRMVSSALLYYRRSLFRQLLLYTCT